MNHNFKVELRVMKDGDTHLQEIKDRVLAFAKERDWEQFHAPKNLSMAIAAEAAELMEYFLWQSPEASRSDMQVENLRAKVEEELADVFIFAIEFLGKIHCHQVSLIHMSSVVLM